MMAIRDHAMAAEAMGINQPVVKTSTFAMSAMYTGLAGSLGAIAVQFVAPDSFGVVVSIFLFVGLIVGGVSSIGGTLIGRRVHRVRAEPRRQGIQGGAGGGVWRDPDRRDVPDAGGRGGLPARHVAEDVAFPRGGGDTRSDISRCGGFARRNRYSIFRDDPVAGIRGAAGRAE